MNQRVLHFTPTVDVEKLQVAAADPGREEGNPLQPAGSLVAHQAAGEIVEQGQERGCRDPSQPRPLPLVPDPDDEPGAEAAQIEVTAAGVTRHVWLSEFNDDTGTQTIVSGRGEDEDDDE